MTLSAVLAVGGGAAAGAWLRWGLGALLNPVFPTLPLGTLAANLIGGYLMGIALASLSHFEALAPEARLLATTGFLGGLTTFSTFSAEAATLIGRQQLGWTLRPDRPACGRLHRYDLRRHRLDAPYSEVTMQGTYLRFYMHENRKHHGILLYEWLLEAAKKAGIQGGSAFRAIAGFGRHGVLHEQHFFELAGDLTVEVEFLVSRHEAEMLLDLLRNEKVRMVYAMVAAEFGTTEGKG